MNKFRKLFAIGAFMIFLVMCVVWLIKANKPVLTSSGSQYHLSSVELQRQVLLARDGDSVAAMRVANFYTFSENDSIGAKPWLSIAAEHGDSVAMQNLATVLLIQGGGVNCELALSWLRRARETSSDTEFLSQLDGRISNLKNDPECHAPSGATTPAGSAASSQN